MNKEVKVVIGANYGDEGKGLVSYCLAYEAAKQGRKILNVFFNGGMQCAHTSGGEILHCSGAGSSFGADTFYHPKFVVDPIALWLERPRGKIFIDPHCRVVVPEDVVNNRRIELARQKTYSHHGSCGMGIFECVKRSRRVEFELRWQDCVNEKPQTLYEKLFKIGMEYGWPRDILYNHENWMQAVQWCRENTGMVQFSDLTKDQDYDTIIFEGGQGLLLDQRNIADFPHLTPSCTGVHNIVDDVKSLGLTPELYYVSRSYMTRHGNGPLNWGTSKDSIDPSIVDLTNEPNPWQGALRFSFLDITKLHERIQRDADELNIAKRINLVYTHLNYTDGKLFSHDSQGRSGFEVIEKPDWCDHVYGSDAKDFMDILM